MGQALERVAEDDRDQTRMALTSVTADWLRSQGGRAPTREAVRALLSWHGFAPLVFERLSTFADALLADQSRVLLE